MLSGEVPRKVAINIPSTITTDSGSTMLEQSSFYICVPVPHKHAFDTLVKTFFLNTTGSFLVHLYSWWKNQGKNYLAASTHAAGVKSRQYIKSSREGHFIHFRGAAKPCASCIHTSPQSLSSLPSSSYDVGFCFKGATTFISFSFHVRFIISSGKGRLA